MVPKQNGSKGDDGLRFRAVLFRMVPKPVLPPADSMLCFRAVLFRMVPKPQRMDIKR